MWECVNECVTVHDNRVEQVGLQFMSQSRCTVIDNLYTSKLEQRLNIRQTVFVCYVLQKLHVNVFIMVGTYVSHQVMHLQAKAEGLWAVGDRKSTFWKNRFGIQYCSSKVSSAQKT